MTSQKEDPAGFSVQQHCVCLVSSHVVAICWRRMNGSMYLPGENNINVGLALGGLFLCAILIQCSKLFLEMEKCSVLHDTS